MIRPALLVLLPAVALAAPPSGPELDRLVSLYKDLHRNPELSFYEKETAARLVEELRPLGFEVETGVGGHGFVAVLRNGEGPTVMIRTDLDALPVVEDTDRPYASDVRTKNDQGQDVGVMHACGHDIHMSVFVGTARALAERKDDWSGTLVMIGQPAEERGAGAREMLADGLYERFPRPDYVLGLHVTPALEAGVIGYRSEFAMANVDSVDVTVRGLGGHGAYPHLAKDPIVVAAQIVLALQTIVSREVSPLDSAVVTVGSVHGGAKHNVIPDDVRLQLTVRSYTDETRRGLLDSIRRIAEHTARAAGMPEDRLPIVKVDESEFTPALYNDPDLVSRLVPVWEEALGEENVVEFPAEMGGEDFARYGRVDPRIPIFMFRLGVIDAERWQAVEEGRSRPPSLHSAEFWPAPAASIPAGVEAMTTAALELLGQR